MDKAIIGHMRIGHFRIGVRTDHWQQFQDAIEKKIGTPRQMVVDGRQARVGEEWRVDGFTPQFWDAFKKSVEK